MEDRWAKLEEIVRRVVREEIAQLGKKPKIRLVNGRWEGVTGDVLETLKDAYPAVDVGKQLKEMAAWILMNPVDAPKTNYSAFIQRWLSKHQNAASLRSIPTNRPTETKVTLCGYCGRSSTGSVNGIPYCNDHSHDAMDMKPRRMLGVVAKPVAGRD
jgi:hypothetical protein